MDLIEQAKTKMAARQAEAHGTLIEIAQRQHQPHKGDDDRLVQIMQTLHLRPEDLSEIFSMCKQLTEAEALTAELPGIVEQERILHQRERDLEKRCEDRRVSLAKQCENEEKVLRNEAAPLRARAIQVRAADRELSSLRQRLAVLLHEKEGDL